MKYAAALLTNLTVIAIVLMTAIDPCMAQESNQSAKNEISEPSQKANAARQIGEITSLLNAQVNAWNDGDLEAFMVTYWKSPKLTFSSGGKVTRGWQATLDRYKTSYSSREKMGKLRFDGLETQLLSADVALVLGEWHLTNSEGNPRGNFSLVLKRLEGDWKIVHDHSSTLEMDEQDQSAENGK